MPLHKRLFAEFIGTFWLVLGGCGSALFAAKFPGTGIGFLGVALAFGLTLVTMIYALGNISGGHFNPAVSFGLFAGGRFKGEDLVPYMFVQVLGAILAAVSLYFIAKGAPDFSLSNGFATNGYAAHSPGGYNLASCMLTEIIMTAMFIMIIVGATDPNSHRSFAPLAIGLGLTLIHLISIPITNTSVNPARSTAPAIIAGGAALKQLWLFWLAPLIGALLGGVLYRGCFKGLDYRKPKYSRNN